jgi:hypothetical protein
MPYAQSMKRLTISVPDGIAAKAQRAVDAGEADSVSGYFGQLADREPDWVSAREAVDALIAETGPISDDDRAWARSVLGIDNSSVGAA